jgi:hypothetical protein
MAAAGARVRRSSNARQSLLLSRKAAQLCIEGPPLRRRALMAAARARSIQRKPRPGRIVSAFGFSLICASKLVATG